MRRRNADVGPQGQVQYMTALNAGQNIGGNQDFVDIDNFYPADGMPENDSEFNDLTNRRSQINKVDMVYDNDINDLGSGSDFFDGDYQNSYADGDDEDDYDEDDYDEDDYYNADDDDDDDDDYYGLDDDDYDDFDDDDDDDDYSGANDYDDFDTEDDDYDYYDSDYDNLDGESFDYATGRKKKKKPAKGSGVLGFAKGRLKKRDERVEERREKRGVRKDERVAARMARKGAKTDEIKSRGELTKSMAQPDNTAQILASLQDTGAGTKSATETGAKKGLSTGAIIGIAVGSLALLGLAAYLILKKKK